MPTGRKGDYAMKCEKVRLGNLAFNTVYYLSGDNRYLPCYDLDKFTPNTEVWVWYEDGLDHCPYLASPDELAFRSLCKDYGMTSWQAGRLWFSKYTKPVPILGKVGASELGMHLGIVQNKGVVAFVRPNDEHMIYAYVLLDNGNLADGSFHLFDNGTFSLS